MKHKIYGIYHNPTEIKIAIGAKIFILPQPNVDNACVALGIVLGQMDCDDLNGFDIGCGKPFSKLASSAELR